MISLARYTVKALTLAGLLALAIVKISEAAPGSAASPALSAKHQSLLRQHCHSCHGPDKQKGSLRLDTLSLKLETVETAEKWQKVLNVMNSGDMPPEEEPQPAPAAKADLLDELAQVMVAARKSLNDQGGAITMRRLNRREYRNSLRELLGVEINVSELPADGGSGSFDTVGSNLFMSANQIEQYQALGREALEEALAWRQASSVEKKLHYEGETTTPKVRDFVKYQHDARERAKKWVQAVDTAIARPENAAIIKSLRMEAKNEPLLRREWARIPGAPNPRSFGFDKRGENDADLANDSLHAAWLKYHEHYISLPAVDRGAYLGTQTRHPAELNVNYIELLVPFDWPVGEYTVRVRVGAVKDAPPERRFLDFGIHARTGKVLATHEITGSIDQPQIIEIPLTLTRANLSRDNRSLFFREKGSWDNNEEGARKRAEGVRRNGIGPELVLWVDWIEVERRPTAAAPMPAGLAALGLPVEVTAPAPAPAALRRGLGAFAKEAFRGQEPEAGFVDRLIALHDTRLKAGAKPIEALKETLSVVLASPMFLYLAEPKQEAKPSGLSPLELATRLSFFLWSAPPDAALRQAALKGELAQPAALSAQVERLLDDPRSEGFLKAFTQQWLGLDRIDFFEINRALYPRFDTGTKVAARGEIDATLSHLLRHNASLRDLLKADYVVINRVLAHYYGMSGVVGQGYEKVALPPNSPRGGLLGMAAILFMGGNGERSSPVERGAWVLRKLLHEPPPPAPANVPAITRLAGQVLSTSERLRAHQQDPQCASCHRRIDPIGLGLENFDAAGQWRTQDSYTPLDAMGRPEAKRSRTWPIEPAGALYRGPAFKDFFALRDLIAARSEAFARGFSEALIEFALGRPLSFRDEPLLDAMLQRARKKDLGMREFIHALVASETFQRH